MSLFVWTSWLSDDAYITFRSLTLLASDQGPNFNPGQRLQVFTHPLWYGLLAVSFFFTHELFHTTQILSIVVSALVVLGFIYLHRDRGYFGLLVGLSLLGLSSSFLDYSTSGLENPLSHLLVIVGLIGLAKISPERNKIRPLFLAAITSLAALTRPDLSLLFLPLLIGELLGAEGRPIAIRYAAVGLTPIVLWEAFSLLYYGFPFPNTAYAKLTLGESRLEIGLQGLRYLASSLFHDPLSILVLGVGLFSVVVRPNRERKLLAAGLVSYLLYLVWIGGDFMRGRFLSAPFLLALMLLTTSPRIVRTRLMSILAISMVFLGVITTGPKLAAGGTYGEAIDHRGAWGIADERAAYYPYTGLMRSNKVVGPGAHPAALAGAQAKESGQPVAVTRTLGLFGYFAGRTVHVVDQVGLSDPLLARMKSAATGEWRIGHLYRDLPDGYVETLQSGENQISDPDLAKYYDRLRILTSGSLHSVHRLLEIAKFNLGWYDQHLEVYESRR